MGPETARVMKLEGPRANREMTRRSGPTSTRLTMTRGQTDHCSLCWNEAGAMPLRREGRMMTMMRRTIPTLTLTASTLLLMMLMMPLTMKSGMTLSTRLAMQRAKMAISQRPAGRKPP